jgi:hypothetical protein
MKNEKNFISTSLKTREERLNHLITVLDRVKNGQSKHFNMSRWAIMLDSEFEFNEYDLYDFEPFECGFAGCALGWASIDPEFNKEGLHLDSDLDPTYILENTDDEPNYGYGAGMSFFHLIDLDNDFLFSPRTYYFSEFMSQYNLTLDEIKDMGISITSGEFFVDGNRHYIYDSTENITDVITPQMVINRIRFLLTNSFGEQDENV